MLASGSAAAKRLQKTQKELHGYGMFYLFVLRLFWTLRSRRLTLGLVSISVPLFERVYKTDYHKPFAGKERAELPSPERDIADQRWTQTQLTWQPGLPESLRRAVALVL